MNKKLIIRNQQNETLQTVVFHEQETLDAFLELLRTQCPWGKPERTEVVEPSCIIHHPAIPAVLGEVMELTTPAKIVNGVEIDPPLYTLNPQGIIEPEIPAWDEIVPEVLGVLPAEYTIEIVDITEQLEQEKINKESEEYLKSSDWKILRHIRQKSLGEQTSLSDEEYLQLEQTRSLKANSIVR